MAELPPPPPRMVVSSQHNGVTWQQRPARAISRVVLGLSGLAGAATIAAAAYTSQLPVLLVLWVPLVLGLAPLANRRSPAYEVIVNDREVVVRRGEETRFPIGKLDAKLLGPESGAVVPVLRLKGADDRVTLQGEGSHLSWMLAAIDEAKARARARDEAEGKEFFFHRQTPAELAALVGNDASAAAGRRVEREPNR